MSGEQQRPVSSQLFEACCVIEGAIAGFAAEDLQTAIWQS
jgi:hypothetical protein